MKILRDLKDSTIRQHLWFHQFLAMQITTLNDHTGNRKAGHPPPEELHTLVVRAPQDSPPQGSAPLSRSLATPLSLSTSLSLFVYLSRALPLSLPLRNVAGA